MSHSVNELLAEVQSARADVTFAVRVRRTLAIAGVLCAACLPGGIALAIWSTLHHINLGGACSGVVLVGVLLGLPLLIASAFCGAEVVDTRRRLWKCEARYHDALARQFGADGAE
jgi:hypothetical protein